MWRQVFHQIRNQRRANAWLWVELTVVLVILWYGIDLVYNYEGAALQPKGYDTDCVFDLQLDVKPLELRDEAEDNRADEDFAYLYNALRDYPGVEAVCYQYALVSYSDWAVSFEGFFLPDDTSHVVTAYKRHVTRPYFQVFRTKLLAGSLPEDPHWSMKENPIPVVISADLADSLFHHVPYTDVVGRAMWLYTPWQPDQQLRFRVAGVVPRQKTDEYARYTPYVFLPVEPSLWWQNISLRVSPDRAAGFAERFRRDMQPVFDRGIFYLSDIRSYADMKVAYDIEKGTVNYLNTVYSVAAFFVFNVFLCVLATFWYRTRKRRCEIALRMAMGSSRVQVMRYFLSEGLGLLLVAAVPALVIAFNLQAADLTVHTLIDASWGRFAACFLGAVALLAVVIVLGIWYPARRAMRIQPAEALHDE